MVDSISTFDRAVELPRSVCHCTHACIYICARRACIYLCRRQQTGRIMHAQRGGGGVLYGRSYDRIIQRGAFEFSWPNTKKMVGNYYCTYSSNTAVNDSINRRCISRTLSTVEFRFSAGARPRGRWVELVYVLYALVWDVMS